MAKDPELDLRGRLVRKLGHLREMLPGSFIERKRKCGKPNCVCAQGEQLHTQYMLSVLSEGRTKTYNIPIKLAEEVRKKVDLHKSFEQAGDRICDLNLQRTVRQIKSEKKEKNKKDKDKS